jgi:hypothetical protein
MTEPIPLYLHYAIVSCAQQRGIAAADFVADSLLPFYQNRYQDVSPAEWAAQLASKHIKLSITPKNMSEITIQASGEVPVKFQGELQYAWDSKLVQGRDRSRWHEVRLYLIDDSDEEVLTICFLTQWPGEVSHAEYHRIASEADITSALQAYDPIRYLVGYPPGAAFDEKRQDLQGQIASDWYLVKGEVYRDLEIAVPLNPSPDWNYSIPFALHREVLREAGKRQVAPIDLICGILTDFYEDRFTDVPGTADA